MLHLKLVTVLSYFVHIFTGYGLKVPRSYQDQVVGRNSESNPFFFEAFKMKFQKILLVVTNATWQ